MPMTKVTIEARPTNKPHTSYQFLAIGNYVHGQFCGDPVVMIRVRDGLVFLNDAGPHGAGYIHPIPVYQDNDCMPLARVTITYEE